MEMNLICIKMNVLVKVIFIWMFYPETRFDTEAKGNSEIVYLNDILDFSYILLQSSVAYMEGFCLQYSMCLTFIKWKKYNLAVIVNYSALP